jgi:hypothetical protein
MNKPKLGDELFLVTFNICHNLKKEEIVKVIKVGKKYFTIKLDDREIIFCIEDWKEHRIKYDAYQYEVYLSRQGWLDTKRKLKLISVIKDYLNNLGIYDTENLFLYDIEQIVNILRLEIED